MKGMSFGFQKIQTEAVIEVAGAVRYWSDNKKSYNKKRKQQQQREGAEPCSVLDSRRSPSPPTSTSTLSSSLGGGGGGGGGGSSDSAGVAAVSENQQPANKWQRNNKSSTEGGDKKEEWASELQPITASDSVGGGLDDWEAIISESAVAEPGSSTHEQTFLRWIMGGDVDDCKQQQLPPPPSADFEALEALVDPGFSGSFDSSPSVSVTPPPPAPNQNSIAAASKASFMPPVSANLPFFYQEAIDEKPHHRFGGNNHGVVINQQQQQQLHPSPNPGFFLPLPPQPQMEAGHLIIPPHPKRHHSMPSQSFPNPPATAVPYSVQQRPPPKPKEETAAAAVTQQQQQVLMDLLLNAAVLVEAGNSFSAREILARLNQILPATPVGLKPLLRSAFLFKEILGVLANSPGSIPFPLSNPWDVVLKLSSYKAFSEVSPLIHFTNFTCTQTILEEVAGADRIHIVDFDIGVGGQWSSFMQELAHRRPTSTPSLRITAFVSPSAFHPLELHLTRDNVSHFAADLNIPFEFTFLNIESFNPNEILAVSANEAIAVNLPIGSHYALSFPTLLRLVKQLNPRIVVSVDQGCDRSDLSFSHHFFHSFQACTVLLDSIDAAGTNADAANKIERFLVQPRVESAVLGRHRAVEKMPPWRALFASVGFAPCQFSNFTESQAECLLKRVQVRGFHVEKRQASLFLYWQRGELGSVSVWKC